MITQEAKQILLEPNPDFEVLGQLMDAHQKILQECIQNTPEAMIVQMSAAKDAGALGTKIIGSGGGGCMVALAKENTKEEVIQAFKEAGASNAYEVQLSSHR